MWKNVRFPRGKFNRLEFTGWRISPGKKCWISPGKIQQVRIYRLGGFLGKKAPGFPREILRLGEIASLRKVSLFSRSLNRFLEFFQGFWRLSFYV